MTSANETREASFIFEPAALDASLLAGLRSVPAFAFVKEEHLPEFAGTMWVTALRDTRQPIELNEQLFYWVLIEGEISITKQEASYEVTLATLRTGETFGEVPLFWGKTPNVGESSALADSRMLRIPKETFWKLIGLVPEFRERVQSDFARRYEMYQAMALHREKLISLGTLAAGLMHELNNPGAAARRASAQLRENISRLQLISLRMSRTPFTAEQKECLSVLQEQVLATKDQHEFSSIEQSDREEALSEWLEEAGVENAWRLAPTFVSMGWQREDIACAGSVFPSAIFSDALNYLDALISSIQHVSTIEESITRVTDLVVAVKKYAYDDKNKQQMVNVQSSLLSTLTILGHKFRQKDIQVDRDLSDAETPIFCVGSGLAQVWTNLLDNAIDASAGGGRITVRLWIEDQRVCVGIRDQGSGIPQEHWKHIFEPFYTTKEVGVGTGLGLDIAHRIVVGNFHGDIYFTSSPEGTEFIVRLPMGAKPGADPACSLGSPQVAAVRT